MESTVQLIAHEKNKSGYFYYHKAQIELTGERAGIDVKDPVELSKLTDEVSIMVGYHPLGYGVYGSRVSKASKENQYILMWSTGTSAD